MFFKTLCLRRWKSAFCLACVATMGTLLSTYIYITAQSHADYVKVRTLKCTRSEEEMAQLVNLTYQVHTILDSFAIEHWLMYGSIFGARRVQGPLPWDYDVDIGMKGEQFSKVKFSDIVKTFKAAGIEFVNHLDRNGLLAVGKPGWPLHVDTFTFYNYHGMRMRPRWVTWLFFVNYRLHHTFPSRLVECTMPKLRFGFFNISVPCEGDEILKYLYRKDWWKQVKPLGCR